METTFRALTEKPLDKALTLQDLSELVAEMSANTSKSFTIAESRAVLKLFKEAVLEAVKQGFSVSMTGLINMSPRYTKERYTKHLRTHEDIHVPESLVMSIKAGVELKKACKSAVEHGEVFEFYKSKWQKKNQAE